MEALDLKRIPSILLLLVAFLSFAPAAVAQPASTALANLPEADALIYISPQRILNDAIPKVMPAAEVAKMQAAFADMKRGVGVDPATVEYIVIAVRFHKPAADLSFVAPDVMAVVGGDFSSESLFTLAQLTLQDKVRMETHGSKTIALMTRWRSAIFVTFSRLSRPLQARDESNRKRCNRCCAIRTSSWLRLVRR